MAFVAWALLLFYFAVGMDLLLGLRTLKTLKRLPSWEAGEPPAVSLVIAARNEKANIEKALRSLLNQDYGNLEIIVMDDRSTDGTSEILERLRRGADRLKVYRVQTVPEGWLGKNHALFLGANRASGELILFMDADVELERSVVSRAVRYLTDQRLDHLTLFPELKLKGVWLNMVVGAFSIIFGLYSRPWKAKDPKSRYHIGIGAFNLIRAEVYRQIGTHRRIAMRPDDDMKLAKLVKQGGFRQDCLLGREMIFVEWYPSLRAMIHGLEKNAFASVDYRLPAIVAATAANLVVFFGPFIGALACSGGVRVLYLGSLCLLGIIYAAHSALQGLKVRYGLGFPVADLIFLGIVWNSTLKALLRNGIVWRDTRYSLDQLRANKI